MQKQLNNWLESNGFGAIQGMQALPGGCISDALRVTLPGGLTLFAKLNNSAPADMFQAEAAGLQALAATESLRIPQVIHAEQHFIILEDLGSGSAGADYWQQLGQGLALLHQQEVGQFGFHMDNYCGATAQDNTVTRNGWRFFAKRRLMALATRAGDRQLLSTAELQQLESICARLEDWIPQMPPVLIHGDLWSGNVHCDIMGGPALIDPATYWGWAEAELAMTELFGGFPRAFYASYAEAGSMRDDWQERAPLYNLYHLLNHLLLFGSSYLGAVKNTLDRFSD